MMTVSVDRWMVKKPKAITVAVPPMAISRGMLDGSGP